MPNLFLRVAQVLTVAWKMTSWQPHMLPGRSWAERGILPLTFWLMPMWCQNWLNFSAESQSILSVHSQFFMPSVNSLTLFAFLVLTCSLNLLGLWPTLPLVLQNRPRLLWMLVLWLVSFSCLALLIQLLPNRQSGLWVISQVTDQSYVTMSLTRGSLNLFSTWSNLTLR